MLVYVKTILFDCLKNRVPIEIKPEMGISDIADFIEYIDSIYYIKKMGFKYEDYIIFVNGMKVKKDYEIKDGDDIILLTPVCGG